MKLLTLSSSNPKFKTLEFQDGLNILVGLQLSAQDKKTINGIGKSFSLYLIHLMLGGTLSKSKPAEGRILNYLGGYGRFMLEFEHNDRVHHVKRDFALGQIIFDNEKLSIKKYQERLGNLIVNKPMSVSFKNLLNIFARRYGGNYYNNPLSQQGQGLADYYQKFANLALLGVDTRLVAQKKQVKADLTKLKNAKKAVEDYKKELDDNNLKDLEDELALLVEQKDNFIIAENYDRYKKQADDLTEQIKGLRDEQFELSKNLGRKSHNLEQAANTEVDIDFVNKVYDESEFFFADKIKVRLEQASEFHHKLMKSRTTRLKAEIKQLDEQAEALRVKLESFERERDLILKDLDAKGALEEYNSIEQRIRTLDGKIKDLNKYQHMLDEFNSQKVKLDLENATIKAKANTHLLESKSHFEAIEDKFRTLVKRFYDNHGGSLKVLETEDAQYLFDIDVQIPRDGSQGINEVKIFCYDLLLHQLHPQLFNFIAHDGCIFSEMDPRQKSMIFKVVIDVIKSTGMQYFVNIGEPSLNEVLDKNDEIGILNAEEKSKIEKGVILRLDDLNASSWLFGESFG